MWWFMCLVYLCSMKDAAKKDTPTGVGSRRSTYLGFWDWESGEREIDSKCGVSELSVRVHPIAFEVSHLEGHFANWSSISLRLRVFCHVPLKGDQWDCDWRIRLNDTPNAIGCIRIPHLFRCFRVVLVGSFWWNSRIKVTVMDASVLQCITAIHACLSRVWVYGGLIHPCAITHSHVWYDSFQVASPTKHSHSHHTSAGSM